MAAGSGKGFHAGASGKQLIYLLLWRCVRGGAVPHIRNIPGKTGQPPRTAVLGEVKTSHPCLRSKSICLWELFGVCVVWDCAAAAETPKLYVLVFGH